MNFKRTLLRATATALLGLGLASAGLAQSYPSKPITWVVPFAAGGPTDVVARLLGASMSKTLGNPW